MSTMRFLIEENFREVDPAELTDSARTKIAEEAIFVTKRGRPLDADGQARAVALWLGKTTRPELPAPRGPLMQRPKPRRMLLPEVMPDHTLVALSGNQKAGKSSLAFDAAASIFDPSRNFLSYPGFGPSALSEGSRSQGLWIVSAEMNRAETEDTLGEQGLLGHPDLVLDVLDELGGGQLIDFRDPGLYDFWQDRLMLCEDSEGRYGCWSPGLVVIDGLTGIMQANVDGYGQWISAFRRLMNSIDAKNSIIVGHSPMSGGHLMGGAEAGGLPSVLWNIVSSDPDNPDSPRYFSATGRGAKVSKGRVRQDPETKRLSFEPGKSKKAGSEGFPERGGWRTPTEESKQRDTERMRADVLSYVAKENAENHGASKRRTRDAVPGDNTEIDAVRDALIAEGVLELRPGVGTRDGGAQVAWLRQEPPADGGKDSK